METCSLCYGTAIVDYRYGIPGQDRHLPSSEVVWDDTMGGTRVCKPCNGTGLRKKRQPARKGWVYFKANGDVDHERTVNEQHRGSKIWVTVPKPSW